MAAASNKNNSAKKIIDLYGVIKGSKLRNAEIDFLDASGRFSMTVLNVGFDSIRNVLSLS